jgi:hypothetical protein
MKRLNQWARLPKKQHVVFACLVLLTCISHANAQAFMLLDGYEARTPHDIRPIYRMYEKHFELKEEAVESHKKVLDLNDIDTASTWVEWDMDTPIFSSMQFFDTKKKVMVTFVTLNNDGGYSSVFMECKNVRFELFESDGYMFEYDPAESRDRND